MTPRRCPHGLPAGDCLICSTLDPHAGRPTPAGAGVEGPGARRLRPRMGGALVALVAVALVAWWALAVLAALLHLAELVAVAVVAGWLGWRLGVRHGRRTRGA
jgi:hypothetical protein